MTDFPLPPNATIGIVGGGQLGRMSAMAAARLGYRCHVYTPEPDAPASQVAFRTTLADYDDTAALARFADSVDVITFEFENVSFEGLALLADPLDDIVGRDHVGFAGWAAWEPQRLETGLHRP
jgi:5-(carboxyamino)imidazole ribonucleotide synthase